MDGQFRGHRGFESPTTNTIRRLRQKDGPEPEKLKGALFDVFDDSKRDIEQAITTPESALGDSIKLHEMHNLDLLMLVSKLNAFWENSVERNPQQRTRDGLPIQSFLEQVTKEWFEREFSDIEVVSTNVLGLTWKERSPATSLDDIETEETLH